MPKYLHFILWLSILLIGCASHQSQPVDQVDPLIGTGFHGHTYPGATTPFGAVQLSPDTRRMNWDACAGYHYSDTTIIGFTHTHLSGTGCIDLGDILVHPMVEELLNTTVGYCFKPTPFSHHDETALAGYYSVNLKNGIRAELTATQHVGVHRYTFPIKGEPKIVIDLAHSLNNEWIPEVDIQADGREIFGMRSTRGWVDHQEVYFVARFSEPFKKVLFSEAADSVPADHTHHGKPMEAVACFPKLKGKSVVVTVGLSSVSVENARQNLMSEMNNFDFDRAKAEATQQWNQALSAYRVEGGNEGDRKNFYTALYHCMVTPNVISDVNGQFRGADQKIHQTNSHKIYSTFSIWDTFRAWNPLFTLTDTAMVNNIINSYLKFYEQSGELPIWPLGSADTRCMIGYHSVSVIYDAYSKGIRGFDAEKAFEAMKVSAEKNPKGTESFLEQGYIPADLRSESVSCLLECSYDDWCIAQMAKALGHPDDYDHYLKKSQLYQNIFDPQTRFFRSRLKNGAWQTPFNPVEVNHAYTEATAWQYRFFVPHDMEGLIKLFGGRSNFANALDSLFNPALKTKGEENDITGMIGQYAHGNEPSHHMAYLYNYIGQPWKSQAMVRKLLKEMYQPTPEGIIGNEDCGQMSAWYVLSSLGLYPVCPGSTQYILTTPLFDRVTVRLANGKQLVVEANNPAENVYIKAVSLNGKPIDQNYITHEQLMQGGALQFILDKEPNSRPGVRDAALPYSLSVKQ